MTTQNGLLIFLWKETHSETKSWKSSRILTKSYNNNGKPWKSSRILRVNPIFSFFFLFSSFFSIFCFSSFFHFFHFYNFFHFLFLSLSFMFLSFFFDFLSFSFIFFHFSVFVGCSKSDFFLGLNFVTISLDSSYVKNQFGGISRVVIGWYPLGPSFPFFPTFFLPFFVFFLAFYFSFFLILCSFLHFLIF